MQKGKSLIIIKFFGWPEICFINNVSFDGKSFSQRFTIEEARQLSTGLLSFDKNSFYKSIA